MDELLVQQKMTAILGDCCSYEGENEYDIGGKTGRMNFLKVQMPQTITKYPSVNMTYCKPIRIHIIRSLLYYAVLLKAKEDSAHCCRQCFPRHRGLRLNVYDVKDGSLAIVAHR